MKRGRKAPDISEQSKNWIERYISHLEEKEDLSVKTQREFASDLRDLAHWFEEAWNEGKEAYQFDPSQLTTKTIVEYRGHMQTVRNLKPDTINWRLITIKRFFGWCVVEGIVAAKKLVPEVKTSRGSCPIGKRPI